MLNEVINNLIPTGIMNHLIENYYTKKAKVMKVGKNPKILDVDDLAFGFNIWLGFCAISGAAFVIELILGMRTCKKNLSFEILKKKMINRKMKFAKVYPIESTLIVICSENKRPSLKLIEKFKIRKNKVSINLF